MNGRWEFLAPSQKAGAPLARPTLVSRCLVDLDVLRFIADGAQRAAELSHSAGGGSDGGHKAAITLFAVVTLEVIAAADRTTQATFTDALIRTLAPHILFAVGCTRCPDYQTAGYMVLTQLCAKFSLDAAVIAALLPPIVTGLDADVGIASLTRPLLCLVR